MALTLAGYSGQITLIDQGGNRAQKIYDLKSATFAEALADLQAILALLEPITDARVEGYTVNTNFREDAFSYPTGGTQVENIAELVLVLEAGIDKTAVHRIPAPSDGIFQASAGKGYNIVDINDAQLAAYIEGVFTTTDGVAYISDGETVQDLGSIRAGKRIHRASRKG